MIKAPVRIIKRYRYGEFIYVVLDANQTELVETKNQWIADDLVEIINGSHVARAEAKR